MDISTDTMCSFTDSRGELTSSYEKAELLVACYNCFAEKNGKEVIHINTLKHGPGDGVDRHFNEWVMLSQSKVLAVRGEVFEARDKVLTLLKSDNAVAHR
jgi:hypothetical protein